MNLPSFLKEVDRCVTGMDKGKLLSAIHELARTLPESQRDDFLRTLQTFGSSKKVYAREATNTDLLDRVKAAVTALDEISQGNRFLEAEYNEEYDPDRYWGYKEEQEEEEYIIQDETNILPDIRTAFSLVHECFDSGAYAAAVPLVNGICTLKVTIDGDYTGDNPCSIRDLDYAVDLKLSDTIHWKDEMAYIMYVGSNEDDRPKNIYTVFSSIGGKCSLESVLQTGSEELQDLEDFLQKWISFLGNKTGYLSDDLIKEAVAMIPTLQGKSNNARKVVTNHPEVYRDILLDHQNEKPELMLSIGLEGMQNVPLDYSVRGQIALLTSDFAKRLNETAAKEKCWLEAFRSSTTPLNFLRLKMETEDYSKYEIEARAVYQHENEHCKSTLEYSHDWMRLDDENPRALNSITKIGYCSCLGFDGRINEMVSEGMPIGDPLGWTGLFMKTGIAWMTVLLYKGDLLTNVPAGIKYMLGNILASDIRYDKTAYAHGLDKTYSFSELFSKYRDTVSLTEEDRDKYISHLESLITIRTDAIMEGNHRRHYEECAAFIAALAEAEESIGLISSKNVMLLAYRQQYSRRSAFHGELRKYGMDDSILRKK